VASSEQQKSAEQINSSINMINATSQDSMFEFEKITKISSDMDYKSRELEKLVVYKQDARVDD